MTKQQRTVSEVWQDCRIGSCHRHQACMYTPCRNPTPSPNPESIGDYVVERAYEVCNGAIDTSDTDALIQVDGDALRALNAALTAREQDGSEPSDYEMGQRDGYEKAVQDIDVLTGGDGEYYASTLPGRGCPDADTMKRGIANRFAALTGASTANAERVRDFFDLMRRNLADGDSRMLRENLESLAFYLKHGRDPTWDELTALLGKDSSRG